MDAQKPVMDTEKRISTLERKVHLLIQASKRPPKAYGVKLLASNDHTELEVKISNWLRKARPVITATQFVADGAEYTYCVMFLYERGEVVE